MTLKDFLHQSCLEYSKDPKVVFLGYNTAKGSLFYGTLARLPLDAVLETPVNENLLLGMACGMAIHGLKPVVCIERFDFMLNGLDALVNHIDKLTVMSGYQIKIPILIRIVVGASKILNSGMQHTQDYTDALKLMLKNTPVITAVSESSIKNAFEMVGNSTSGTVVLVEHKDDYDKELPA